MELTRLMEYLIPFRFPFNCLKFHNLHYSKKRI
ncbi:hypothetical protein SCOR_01310 [Sulfidibacter corallicola]